MVTRARCRCRSKCARAASVEPRPAGAAPLNPRAIDSDEGHASLRAVRALLRADLAALEVAQAVEEVRDHAIACRAGRSDGACRWSVPRRGGARFCGGVPTTRNGVLRRLGEGLAWRDAGGGRTCDHGVGEDGVVEVLHLAVRIGGISNQIRVQDEKRNQRPNKSARRKTESAMKRCARARGQGKQGGSCTSARRDAPRL